MAPVHKKAEPVQHLRLVGSPRDYLPAHIFCSLCHMFALINPSMCLHSWSVRSFGLCFKAVPGRVLQESWARGENPGAEMGILWSSVCWVRAYGLYCYVVAMEKNTGSCAIKSSRKRHFQEFFRVKKQTANRRIHEVLRSTTQPLQSSILERSYSFYGSGSARALSPNYFCKQICFPMNGGGTQNQCLRMECVILGTDVVGVLSPISLTDNSSNKWKQVKCYLISVKYYYIHTLTVRSSYIWARLLVCQREENIFRRRNS